MATTTADHSPDASGEAEDYLPLFAASGVAALVTVGGQIGSSILLAVERGIPVKFDFWQRFLPVLALQTHPLRFGQIIEHACLLTAVLLAIVGTQSMVRRRRLQEQAGYAFAWLDMALIGAVQMAAATWLDSGGRVEWWMGGLVLVGSVGFAVALTLIAIDYYDRRSLLAEATPSEGDAVEPFDIAGTT